MPLWNLQDNNTLSISRVAYLSSVTVLNDYEVLSLYNCFSYIVISPDTPRLSIQNFTLKRHKITIVRRSVWFLNKFSFDFLFLLCNSTQKQVYFTMYNIVPHIIAFHISQYHLAVLIFLPEIWYKNDMKYQISEYSFDFWITFLWIWT